MDTNTSPKAKKAQRKSLFRRNNPNKVGCSVESSPEASCANSISKLTNVSSRPLSLDLSERFKQKLLLRRCSSSNEEEFLASVKLCSPRCASHDPLIMDRGNGGNGGKDVLAKQSLLAASVLISAHQARKRNFLQGRFAANSLLGAAELEKVFPDRTGTVFVGTWNMNGQNPPKELNDFVLPSELEHIPDVLAFGTQETCPEKFEWEVSLQETVGPSHVLLHSVSLGTLHLAVFIRRDLIWYCSIAEEASISVRPGTVFRTKGAVAVAFLLFGSSFLFITAHLTAHEEKMKERLSDVKKIVRSLDMPKVLPSKHKNKDVTKNFDFVFWCGDLNFRLTEPRENVLKWIQKTEFPLPPHLPHGYLHTDQLQAALAEDSVFDGFSEAPITFPPTYKYDPGTQSFDTSMKRRTPSYTDRILYKSRSTLAKRRDPVECLFYDSAPSITTSDHKPVWGVFRVQMRPGIDSIPLAAGLFNRNVYLEGIKRRAHQISEATTVCSIS